jgi:hypothetical protein
MTLPPQAVVRIFEGGSKMTPIAMPSLKLGAVQTILSRSVVAWDWGLWVAFSG